MINPIYKPKGAALERKTVASHGYVLVRCPGHPNAFGTGYVYEHRLVMEKILGRLLEHSEIVHHKDGNKQNNSPKNLVLFKSIAHHKVEHRSPESRLKEPDEENPLIQCACGCGESFLKYDDSGRPRQYSTASHRKRIQVVQLSNDGTIINIFPGIRAAGGITGIHSSSIMACCKGRRKTAGGFRWRHYDQKSNI